MSSSPKQRKSARLHKDAISKTWKVGEGLFKDEKTAEEKPSSPATEEKAETEASMSAEDPTIEPTESPIDIPANYELRRKEQFSLRDLHFVNKLLRDFIQDPHIYSIPFMSISKIQRLQLQKLACTYSMRVQTLGSGTRKYLQLTKTRATRLIPMEQATDTIAEILVKSANAQTNDKFELKRRNKKKGKQKNEEDVASTGQRNSVGKRKGQKKGERASKKNNKNPLVSGPLVAQDARPIGESNLGNRLLRSMGWDGGGLGPEGKGIVAPIDAVIKNNKRGIGFL